MTARVLVTDFVYESIKERGTCTKTGAVTVIEQIIDRDGDVMWQWFVMVPKARGGSTVNAQHLSGDAVISTGLARARARAAVAEHLQSHPQNAPKDAT